MKRHYRSIQIPGSAEYKKLYESERHPKENSDDRNNKYLKRNKVRDLYDMCVLDIVQVNASKNNKSTDSQDTMDISDVPEGEPDDQHVVIPSRPEVFSHKYYTACLVLDRVIPKRKPIINILEYQVSAIIDTSCERNTISRDMWECVMQNPEKVSVTDITQAKVKDYTPAKRVLIVALKVQSATSKVRSVTLMEQFVVIEDTALMSVALGRVTVERLFCELHTLRTRETNSQTQSNVRKDNTVSKCKKFKNSDFVRECDRQRHDKMQRSINDGDTSTDATDDELFRTADDINDPEVEKELKLLLQAKMERDEAICRKQALLSMIRAQQAELQIERDDAQRACVTD